MFRSFRTAVSFLTRLPINPRKVEPQDLRDSVKYFPLVGVVYGLVTWSLFHLAAQYVSTEIAAWTTVFGGAFLNGCIHWDGFADTADGFGSAEPEKSLLIMKDNRLGAFGAIALIFLITGKIFALPRLINFHPEVFIAIATLSRWGMAYQIYTQPSVSKGLLQAFHPLDKKNFGLATLLMLFLIGFAWPYCIILFILTLLTLIIINPFIRRRFGGITGDILGASNELIELVCWLALNIKINL